METRKEEDNGNKKNENILIYMGWALIRKAPNPMKG